MMTKRMWLWAVLAATLLLTALFASATADVTAMTPKETLGEFLYFDENLSQPGGQACASCHHPDAGFADPDDFLPVSEGVLPLRFGGRNSPSAAYAMFAPIFYYDATEGLYIGGQFWDGRATGDVLGDPLADQALGPFTNPVEMANHEKFTVVRDVANSDYKQLFEMVWETDLDGWSTMTPDQIAAAYDQVALSIAAFERTTEFAPFNSKYDAYLKACLELGGKANDCAQGKGRKASIAGQATFSAQEWYGLQLFMGDNDNDGQLAKNEGAMCSACHVAEWTEASANVVTPAWAPEGLAPPVFTDFTFDNLGIPKNLAYPLDADAPVDLGLGAVVGNSDEYGKFKVMTLRNVGATAPYGHNGFFGTLKEITNFYNTRDVGPWPMAEYPPTVNHNELGDLGLSAADEDALVAFMMTLTDGYMP